MKKIGFLLFFGTLILGSISCKKDYECCYLNSDGERFAPDDACTTAKYKKSEAEVLESRMTAAAAVADFNGSAICEKV